MDMRASRRLECESQLVRPPVERHLQTFTLPFEKTVHSVPYYSRKKRQLRARNLIYKQQQQSEKLSQLKSVSPSQQDHHRRRTIGDYFITEVTVQPVFNDNKFTNFNPDLYPLNESEKVKVVEQKYFPLQNYYNYICAMKSKQEIFRLAEETQQRAREVINKGRSSGQYFDPTLSADMDDRKQIVKETRKIKGNYESRFDPSGGNFNSQSMAFRAVELSPIHFEYQGNSRRESNPFDVKECDRQTIVREINEKSRKR